MNIPQNLKYEKTDEWAAVDAGKVTIGITDYAQSQLSDIVFLEYLVATGDDIKKGDVIATIESVKAAAEVSSPVSGKVTAVNDDLIQTPEKINTDPYGEAWLVKVEDVDVGDLSSLMDAASYENYCQERGH
ncbi:MAG: glycine cleavage system protein GcvH [Anaerolineae bacterium]|jgi:glycine cleavage system H protein|nr:glycine cleavage system protein GcvH [Anaerolineae bacterium]